MLVKLHFELAEAPLQFPLRRCLFIRIQKGLACGRRLRASEYLSPASDSRWPKRVGSRPQARSREEVMLHTRPCQLFQILVAQVIVGGGAHIFMRKVDAAHTLVIGREGHRYTRRAIVLKRVLVAGD